VQTTFEQQNWDYPQIWSWTDSPHVADQRVWYCVEFRGLKSEPTENYGEALAHAEALCAEHDTAMIDRSDKGCGLLLWQIGKGPLPGTLALA
jgi:hypothetical protein